MRGEHQVWIVECGVIIYLLRMKHWAMWVFSWFCDVFNLLTLWSDLLTVSSQYTECHFPCSLAEIQIGTREHKVLCQHCNVFVDNRQLTQPFVIFSQVYSSITGAHLSNCVLIRHWDTWEDEVYLERELWPSRRNTDIEKRWNYFQCGALAHDHDWLPLCSYLKLGRGVVGVRGVASQALCLG